MLDLYPSKPCLGTEELESIQRVFDSNWLGQGEFVKEFETQVGKYIGAKNVVAVNSGTSALHLALEAIGISNGDEVIVPSLTFCGSVQVITALGARPVFCEVSSNDLNLDIADVETRITSKTKAIIPVHYCGKACNMDALLSIKDRYNIRIIEDAAHAFGSSYKGKRLGSFGDICCFSFDPIKNITCGEGGAILVQDDSLADLLRKKRMLGIDRDGWTRHKQDNNRSYDVSVQGFRYHMSNINAAIGLAQLKKIDSFLKKKRAVVKLYNDRFSHISELSLLDWDLSETFPFAYVLRVQNDQRDDLARFLKKKGISTTINYIPNHFHSFFKSASKLPKTEKLYGEILTLPLYYDLTFDQIEYVIRAVEDYFKRSETRKERNIITRNFSVNGIEDFENRRVLITGGLGFIGSNLALKLSEIGAKVEIIDALIPDHGGNPFNMSSGDKVLNTHIFKLEEDAEKLAHIVSDKDYIFNLAGQSNHWDSMRNPYNDLSWNCSSHLTLLEAIRKYNPDSRVLYTSTRQVYGRPQYLPVKEDHPINPIDINGIHKVAAEHYHLLYQEVYGIKAVILRLTNTYGPRMRVIDAKQTFLGFWLRCAVENRQFEVWGGDQKRDFNFIDDVIDAMLLSATNDSAIGKVYNLGGTENCSLLELARIISRKFGGSYIIRDFPNERLSIDIGDYYANYDLLHKELGWKPQTGLEIGLQKTIDFLQSHLNQYVNSSVTEKKY